MCKSAMPIGARLTKDAVLVALAGIVIGKIVESHWR